MSAVYFNSRFSPRLWRDESNALDLSEAARRFPQWTFLPILPDREETLRNCIRGGVSQNLWAVVVGDNATSTYQQLIDTPEALDQMVSLFDGSASLVKGDLLQLIREELRPATAPETPNVPHEHGVAPDNSIYEEQPTPPDPPPVIPPPIKRLTKVRLNVNNLDVSKTGNLQPYLFRLLQEQGRWSPSQRDHRSLQHVRYLPRHPESADCRGFRSTRNRGEVGRGIGYIILCWKMLHAEGKPGVMADKTSS